MAKLGSGFSHSLSPNGARVALRIIAWGPQATRQEFKANGLVAAVSRRFFRDGRRGEIRSGMELSVAMTFYNWNAQGGTGDVAFGPDACRRIWTDPVYRLDALGGQVDRRMALSPS